MWSSELDREVDPLEIATASDSLYFLKHRRFRLLDILEPLFCDYLKQSGDVRAPRNVNVARQIITEEIDELLAPVLKELEIISNLGEGDEYDLSNAHRRPE